ncbi:MAG TPA: AMP-binding protein [Geminicoccaceae bacterium]|nr:AMP-binding protein [Geminicoccaceae bacterium]
MNLANLFMRAGRAHGELPAVALGADVLLSYGELVRRGAVLAGRLRATFDLAPGDRVALVMKNVPEYVELVLAGWYAGLTMVPANAKLHARELQYILDHSGARVCFVTPDLIDGVGPLEASIATLERIVEVGSADYRALLAGDPAAMTEVAPDDVAWLFYTSGTTGQPKGAMLTHRNLLAMTLSYFADVDQIAPGDAVLHAAPLSHGSGCYALPHAAKAACQVIPASGGFDPAEIFELFHVHRGVTLFAAPTMVKRLAEHPGAANSDHPGLKTIVYGGGPMYLADLDRAHAVFGHRLAQIYGQGESPMCITALDKRAHADTGHPRHPERLASAGTAQLVVEVMIADQDDRPLPPGEIGEVLARGDSVMRGYWRNPEATAATLRGGWLHTGDVGSMDQDGFLTLRDRSKDLIISGGANIYPREVEEALLRHPAVAEVSVVGRPDPDWGEAVVAFVVAAPGTACDAAALDAHCLDHIARFKRPKDYRFVEALPKNNYGKVLKTELRILLSRTSYADDI